MKLRNYCMYVLAIVPLRLVAQFDGVVGTEGCQAIHCNDARIIAWASACEVTRGYQDIAVPTKGYTSYGTEADVIGKVMDSNTTKAVSLGDGGTAVLTFETPIANGEGYDFLVFENAWHDAFLELAFVEVSSDGIHYYRFPATSLTQTQTQTGAFDSTDASLIHNLAGKYRVGWGTPFDLEDLLPADQNLDINNIQYIKIIDVIGTINPDYASRDAVGNIINDPYPTAFASGGFDLTGVGIIHNKQNTAVALASEFAVTVYPNPCKDVVSVFAEACTLSLYNTVGQKLMESQLTETSCQLTMSPYPQGVYFLYIHTPKIKKCIKIIKH